MEDNCNFLKKKKCFVWNIELGISKSKEKNY